MKKYIILLASVTLSLLSCSKIETRLLYVKTIGRSTIESYLTDYDGYITVGEGMHNELRLFYTTFIKYGEIAGDLVNLTSDASEPNSIIFNFESDPSHTAGYPKSIWDDAWSPIREANNLLFYGPTVLESDISTSQKAIVEKIMAQAYFVRALVSFNLCSCFAQPYNYTPDHSHIGIPVVTGVPSFNDPLPRASISAVYKQILSDINSSLETFDKAAQTDPSIIATGVQKDAVRDCYHASYIAAQALMAKVSLYMEDWENAEKYSKIVMDKVPLAPYDEYVPMFRNSQAVPGRESILRMNAYNTTSNISALCDPTRKMEIYPIPGLENKYDIDDIRRTLLTYVPEECEDSVYQGNTYPAICKHLYLKSIDKDLRKVADVFVFRASEMYLIHAEAVINSRADIETAKNDVIALIARARNTDVSRVSVIANTPEQAKELVARERVRELCFEGHRLFDITRRKENLVRSATSNARVKKLAYPDYRFILPINQKEMEGNISMTQNEGYPKHNGR